MSRLSSAKKPKGRPTVDSEPVNVRIERETLTRLDGWRRKQADLPSRPEAIRRLLSVALSSAKAAVITSAILAFAHQGRAETSLDDINRAVVECVGVVHAAREISSMTSHLLASERPLLASQGLHRQLQGDAKGVLNGFDNQHRIAT